MLLGPTINTKLALPHVWGTACPGWISNPPVGPTDATPVAPTNTEAMLVDNPCTRIPLVDGYEFVVRGTAFTEDEVWPAIGEPVAHVPT